MDQQESEEEQFYKVLQENLRYAFTSPMAATQAFPTPYSQGTRREKEGEVEPGKTRTSLNDVNAQPSMVLNFENFSNELLLEGTEQLRELLQESPAGGGLWQAKTPAKTPGRTPLKFLHQQQLLMQSGPQQTPLQNIDINHMLNSAGRSVASPSKRLYALTPHSRKPDVEPPYMRACVASSNSALADFQRARKEHGNTLMRTPVAKKTRPGKRPDMLAGAIASSPSFASALLPTAPVAAATPAAEPSLGDSVACDGDDADEQDCYGSSPTTIQLTSSVSKSARAHLGESPPLAAQREPAIDNRLFDIAASPTPKVPKPPPVEPLRVPELPKLGSFKSVTRPQLIPSLTALQPGQPTALPGALASTLFLDAASVRTTANPPRDKARAKTSQPQHSKFQFIMTNANSFTPNADGTTKRRLKRSQSAVASDAALRLGPGGSAAHASSSSGPYSNKKRKKNFAMSQ
ncbi:AaceriADR415Cp [[Ashbya] aceris (nom. inval.)]|nr:AaceriADR415Cp [[Ashbya] aceris (nom. inval.)]